MEVGKYIFNDDNRVIGIKIDKFVIYIEQHVIYHKIGENTYYDGHIWYNELFKHSSMFDEFMRLLFNVICNDNVHISRIKHELCSYCIAKIKYITEKKDFRDNVK